MSSAIVALLAAPAAVHAQPADTPRPIQGELEVRAGAQLPLGRSEQGQSLHEEVATSPRVPVVSEDIRERAAHHWLGAGVRVAFVAP